MSLAVLARGRLWPTHRARPAIGAGWGLSRPPVKTATIAGHPAWRVALWQATPKARPTAAIEDAVHVRP